MNKLSNVYIYTLLNIYVHYAPFSSRFRMARYRRLTGSHPSRAGPEYCRGWES